MPRMVRYKRLNEVMCGSKPCISAVNVMADM